MRLGLLAISFCAATAVCGQTFQHSYGIVIGIGTYQFNKELPNARADAVAIAAFLKSQHYEVIELYNQEAKRSVILDAMDKVASMVNEHDRVVFFFSGHGYTETRGGRDWGYVVPYDGRPGTTSSMIGMEELRTQSERMGQAKHQLFLMDSCYGGSIGMRDSPSKVDAGTPNYLEEITKRTARQALTAGGKDQQVEDGANGHSRFTAALLEALQDGNADLNSDGYITFAEVSAYILSRATSRQQTPTQAFLPGHGLGEYWFVSPRRASAAVAPASLSSRVQRGIDGTAEDSGLTVIAPPALELRGPPPGFEPISIEKGYKGKPVLPIGTDALQVRKEGYAGISITFKGLKVGSLICERLSVNSSPATVVDPSGAMIPDVDHITLKSVGTFTRETSFSYYSAKMPTDQKTRILHELDGVCAK